MTETELPNFNSLEPNQKLKLNKFIVLAVLLIGLGSGILLSRQSQTSTQVSPTKTSEVSQNTPKADSTDQITDLSQLVQGKLYGSTSALFQDKATGQVEKGGINNVGTHTLKRKGGSTQNASLTSSTVDLDLFVGKEVEIVGQTNSSTKTGWLLDVGSIKILQ